MFLKIQAIIIWAHENIMIPQHLNSCVVLYLHVRRHIGMWCSNSGPPPK